MWGIKRIRLSRLGSCQREKGLEYSLVALTLLPAVGFLVGFLVSLVGGSGGVFYVPLLILGFGVDPRIAVTTSLATMVPTAIIGSLSHREFGNLNVRAGDDLRTQRHVQCPIGCLPFQSDFYGCP
jgi:hypothetical protein